MNLADLPWPAVDDVASASILAVPVGSTEQHGPHLPLSTDTDVAVAVAQRLANSRSDVLVAPALAYGSSGEHAGFAGTLSIGQDALQQVLVELVRSADAFRGVVLVSGHGGNAAPVSRAVAWAPEYRGDLHAGRVETSLALALSPARVRLDRAEAGDRRRLPELIETLRTGGVAAVSANGVLGDPDGATGTEGTELLDAMGESLAAAVAAWIAG
jgi:mycofactocin system creatininase family protein